MGEHVIKLPDVGEGVAEAELVEWHVKVGDLVREDALLAAVMTDKATVEIPSPADGEVLWLGADIGDTVAVGSPLVRLKVAGEGNVAGSAKAEVAAEETGGDVANALDAPAESAGTMPDGNAAPEKVPAQSAEPARGPTQADARKVPARVAAAVPRAAGERPLASPAVRLRAREAGVDLRQVAGSGPAGRILHEDVEAFLVRGQQPAGVARLAVDDTVSDIKIVGLRRKIAEKMALAKSRIAHITYVEEIDVTALEDLRAALNKDKRAERPRLTLLPFLMRAMVRAIAEQPGMNAHFDDEAGIIHRYGGVHFGIATQTPGRAGRDGGQARRSARSLGLRNGGQPAGRGCAGGSRDARGIVGIDHHHHLAWRDGRRRHHAGHQSSRKWRSSASTR